MPHTIIIGNGIAGITAARHIRKYANNVITVISGETDFFFSRTALMYIYMGHMTFEHTQPYEKTFWKKNRIDLKRAWVRSISTAEKAVELDNGEQLTYDHLILATGSKSNTFGWPGEDLEGVQGLYSYQDLELMQQNTKNIKKAVIVGGGLIGVEMAEMLHSRNIDVTYLVRESHFWGNVLPTEEATMVDEHLEKRHIDLRKETELKTILPDEKGKVRAVQTSTGEEIACQFVGLAVGVHPNIALAKKSGIACEKGILVDEYLQTNEPNVYAIGDCAQLKNPLPHRRAIEAVWYAGRMMGETVAYTITKGATKYLPGIWFNSAKFFDLEYQTYGHVPAKLPSHMGAFFWRHPSKDHCIKLMYKKDNFQVVGVNLLGIRSRHSVWDKWLKNEKTLSYVIEHLQEANFDPEFFAQWEPDIQQSYNSQFPEATVVAQKKNWLQKIFA